MTPRLPVFGDSTATSLGGVTRSERRRRHAFAWSSCLWQIGSKVASAMRLSSRLVEGWGNPADISRSPSERMSEAMWLAIDLGVDPAKARAPLAELAREHGWGLYSLPKPSSAGPMTCAAVEQELGEVITHFGAVVQTVGGALCDRKIDRSERPRIREAVRRLLDELRDLEGALDALAEVDEGGAA